MRARFFAGFLVVYSVIIAYATYVMRQPPGTYSTSDHAKRILPLFVTPGVFVMVYLVSSKMHALLERRANRQIKSQETRLRKAITDLRTATHYQRIEELLRKWDPTFAPLEPIGNISPGRDIVAPGSSGKRSRSAIANRAASVAASAVTGAGVRVSSMLGSMLSDVADKIIGDDPTLIAMLEQTKQKATQLEHENLRLLQENAILRQAIHKGDMDVQYKLNVPENSENKEANAPEENTIAFGSPIASEQDFELLHNHRIEDADQSPNIEPVENLDEEEDKENELHTTSGELKKKSDRRMSDLVDKPRRRSQRLHEKQ